MPRKTSPIQQVLSYWRQYCPGLGARHVQWLGQQARVLEVRRGKVLFEPGDKRDLLYFVCRGLLAVQWWDEQARRRIELLLPPRHNVATRPNLYARGQLHGEVVALRRSTVVALPVPALRALKEHSLEASTLVHVLENKRLKQYRHKEALFLLADGEERYKAFLRNEYMKELRQLTSQQEHADYLNLSRRTIARAIKRF